MPLYEATLKNPPGINQMYNIVCQVPKGGGKPKGRMYLSARARDWKDAAFLDLRRQGWRTLPERPYWIAVLYASHVKDADADAKMKIAQDAMAEALGINDIVVGTSIGIKIPVAARSHEHLRVWALVIPLSHSTQFVDLSTKWLKRALRIMRGIQRLSLA